MIDYSIINDEQAKHVAVRGTVKSFNLDHVTDKDLTSFFTNLSKYAHVDTGLLPLDGTGLLAYRQAANHAQIVVQHAPGISRILWGQHEGDSSAKTYMLAQPYRIIIGDILNGNFYGARIFYSINPITSPSQQLYHVNLPNINCRGYRGNGVGWVCLYHRDDWTQIPLGEKVSRLIERCSGSEAYNDANMSETDGPRFYASHGKPSYIINPSEWEQKTQEEGFIWTLQEDLWIPILVKDRDNQGQHFNGGIPLTLGMALTGDYQAYYTDREHTKPVNAIARDDKEYSSLQSFTIIKQAYTEAPPLNSNQEFMNPYMRAQEIREQYAQTTSGFSQVTDQDEDEDSFFTCNTCESTYSYEDTEHYTHSDNTTHCQSCFEEYFVYCEYHDVHLHSDDAIYIDEYDAYIPNDEVYNCPSCDSMFYLDANESNTRHRIFLHGPTSQYNLCTVCLDNDSSIPQAKCQQCNGLIPLHEEYQHEGLYTHIKYIDIVDNIPTVVTKHFHAYPCASHSNIVNKSSICPCGNLRDNPSFLLGDDVQSFEYFVENGSFNDVDEHAFLPVSKDFTSFNPLKLIADHNNITLTESQYANACGYVNACKSCVCVNQDTKQVSFDASKFDINNFEALKQLHNNSIEG